MDYYDTYDVNVRNKIFSSHITKLIDYGVEDYMYPPPIYQLNSNIISNDTKYNTVLSELLYLNIPTSYIDSSDNNIMYGYVQFSFYSAFGGNFYVFYNKDNENLLTPERMCVKVEINKSNKTWKFISNSISSSKTLNLYEYTRSSNYLNKLNNSVNKTSVIKQNYPDGNFFNYETREYENNIGFS